MFQVEIESASDLNRSMDQLANISHYLFYM